MRLPALCLRAALFAATGFELAYAIPVMAVEGKTGFGRNAEAPPVASRSVGAPEGAAKLAVAAGRGGATVSGRVIELPPLTVSAAVEELPWNYLEIPGYEILSRCKPAAVVRWAHEIERLHQWLGVMLPDELRIKKDVPTAVILYDLENKPEFSPEVVKDILRQNGATDGKTIAYRSLPNMRLADKDAMGYFFILDPSIFGAVDKDISGEPLITIARDDVPAGVNLKLRAEYVHYLAKTRAPALPAWFVEGVVDLFETADFNRSAVVVEPLTWLNPAETKEIKKSPDDSRQIPPLEELFAATRNPDRNEVLRNEAVLFIRWGLDGKNQPRKEALWKFIKLASTEPATEEMFQECFGYGYADARQKIGDYLSAAVSEPLRLVPGEKIQLPPLKLRPATKLDIARIKGDWDRLEINYVKSHYPELTTRYVDQARRTLHRAYDKGERDPRLLAIMGLCECDASNDVAARPYLEAAVQGGVVRPRANYELARLRYAEARTKTELPGGKLTADQAAAVLQPLTSMRRQQPPLLETYALTAEVWARTDLMLTRRQLAVLDEGVGFFPWNAPLIYQTAWLNAQHGFKSEAEALIARGLKINSNIALGIRFENLRAALAASPSQSGETKVQ